MDIEDALMILIGALIVLVCLVMLNNILN